MKGKKPIKREERTLTARIPADLHEKARMKMFPRRESFQDVISEAIERYVEADDGVDLRSKDDLGKKGKDISTTYGANATSELRIYLQAIWDRLDSIDRRLAARTSGDPIATFEIDPEKSDSVERHTVGRPGHEADERKEGDSDRAREVIERAERSLENARRSPDRDQSGSPKKDHARKKVG